jgi:transposase-like protein
MERESKRKRRKFTQEYKHAAVRLVENSGKFAVELGVVGETAIRRWVEQAGVEAGRGPSGALKRSCGWSAKS